MQGGSYSPINRKVALTYQYCLGKPYCANETEMAYFFSKATIRLNIVDYWFDLNNYEKPLTPIITENYFTINKMED